jgi:glycerol-3-phosphate dehydrogenase (NAD(P)+)
LGAGAWGTALAVLLARSGCTVTLVPRRLQHALQLATQRENADYLPGIPLEPNIQIGSALAPSLLGAEYVFLACPSHALAQLCQQLAQEWQAGNAPSLLGVLCLCKGLDPHSLLLPTQVVQQHLPAVGCGVLTGPCYAREVALAKPTAAVLATQGIPSAPALQEALSQDSFRVYTSPDCLGAQLGACLKNVYALGAGLSDGLDLGDNARAAYLTRALHEMVKIGTTLGGQGSTLYGLSGFGDLVATALGSWSRNRQFGFALGQGHTPQALLEGRRTVVEGYWATRCFHERTAQYPALAQHTPLLHGLYHILYQQQEPREVLRQLMLRPLKAE